MNIDFALAPWGMAFAGFMYIMGNGAWMNHLARKNAWMGWLLWIISAAVVLVLGAAVEQNLAGKSDIWTILSGVSMENHWIIITLYALISIPGAASVLFGQAASWTQLAVLATTLIIFIPLGSQLQDPNDSRLMLSLGITLAVGGLMWLWSVMLDCDPEHKRKTVPVEEMDQ
ncbi:hypothetical protein MMIC_P1919 [Mariprofundus micogutta]|uniref:Uncharacterized protein n=1 Tax=Mariprofundus micogutta TaxID=1921010 RepID=A0A1L8CPU7_9PROT|nr:hypothetical protein [Mariprofundus micogutta]GAV20941.1 hypothetical protein MMIC_P1919 [Mariprofundus micogutta]